MIKDEWAMFVYICVLSASVLLLVALFAVSNTIPLAVNDIPLNCAKSEAEAGAIYARGALSVAMRDMCEKQWNGGGHTEYGSPKYREYTLEHGEPNDCDELLRILRKVGEK